MALGQVDMEALYAVKYNAYWYLSFAAPAVIMLVATFWLRKWVVVLGMLISLSVAVPLRMASVRVRWDRQAEIAHTFEELHAAQARDLHPIVEVAILAPSAALLNTALWSVLGWIVWAWIRAIARKRRPHFGERGSVMPEITRDTVRVFVNYTTGILVFLVWLTYFSCVGWQYNNYESHDPMSDTGSALGYGVVVTSGFACAVMATALTLFIWLAYSGMNQQRRVIPGR